MAKPVASDKLHVPNQAVHPRRTPAQSSVSLRHAAASARAKNGSASTSGSCRREQTSSDGNGSPSSLEPHRNSSGESSNAEHWFNKTNNEVREGGGSFGDNEPPFFMRNSSSLETPPDIQQHSNPGHTIDSLPLRTELLQLGTEGSGTDDFRSVIDDLTVQNKKLKRRLKKYEKLHDAHLKDDKLFEVRIHGLPPEKKRELEDMLRKFASSLGTTGENAFPTDGYNTLLPMLNKESSNPPGLYHSDSAYASMSMSGPGSSAVSGSDSKLKGTPRGHLSARQKNVHSYLHDIPNGLLPRQASASMTERAKKKLVVRKMEQLFVGKGAVGGHHQPLQQQEVSLSAAQADRSAMAAAGQRAHQYGAREAHMLGRKKSDKDKVASPDDAPAQGQKEKPQDGGEKPGQPGIEQRPTQPIDLDPDRAQVPLDNIRYMRSMGFSPQHPDALPEEGHGWIYINFLFNMAQLHTLHVTTDFVRDALSEMSKKLEVSSDGRKVRWRGGQTITRSSSAGDMTPETGNSSEIHDSQSPRKRAKLTHGNNSNRSSAQAMGGASTRHTYTPLFHHKSSMDDSDASSSDDEEFANESPDQCWDAVGDSSGVTSSGMQLSTRANVADQKRKKAKGDDGPIIFYNNARFCTDLSGDRRPTINQNAPLYTTLGSYPIGDRCHSDSDAEGRGPLADAVALPEAMDLDDNPIDQSHELSVHPHSPPRNDVSRKEQQPIELEVTGIGGVWPVDNFTMNVETRHAHIDAAPSAGHAAVAGPKAIPHRFASILSGSAARKHPLARVGHEVTDVEVKQLQPSELPPALGFMDTDETSEECSDGDEDDMSPDLHEPDRLPPQISARPVDFGYRYPASSDTDSADDEEDETDEDDDSDDEVDLLAGIREAHPEFVRAQEREYDANMAERLAEEIPAGSSAATAGGGSGYASPASGVAKEDVRQAREALGSRPPGLERQESGSSVEVQGLEGSEAGGSDNEDDEDDVHDVDDEMSAVRS